MNFLNPYSYIAGAVFLAAICGSFYYQGTQVHHWHTKYDADEKTIAVLQERIHNMQVTQSNQTKATEQNITRIINIPKETKTIVKEVHDTPAPADCTVPNFSEDVKNAF